MVPANHQSSGLLLCRPRAAHVYMEVCWVNSVGKWPSLKVPSRGDPPIALASWWYICLVFVQEVPRRCHTHRCELLHFQQSRAAQPDPLGEEVEEEEEEEEGRRNGIVVRMLLSSEERGRERERQ